MVTGLVVHVASLMLTLIALYWTADGREVIILNLEDDGLAQMAAALSGRTGIEALHIISHGADGKPFTKTQQVHMCGNSVSPPPMAALARANDPWRQVEQMREAA